MKVFCRSLIMSSLLAFISFPMNVAIGAGKEGTKLEQPDIIAVSLFDNFTYSASTTSLGVVAGTIGLVSNKLSNPEKYKGFRIEYNSNGTQFMVFPTGLADGQSWGAFNLSNGGESQKQNNHEAGHAKQAAILGPVFLPILALSYPINTWLHGGTHTHNNFEDWADAWEYVGDTMVNSHPLAFQVSRENRDGRSLTRVGASYTLLERNSKVPIHADWLRDAQNQSAWDDPVTVSYKYGQIGVHGTVHHEPCDSQRGTPIKLEGTLFQKDFLAEWATVSNALRVLIDSKQETGKVVVDLDYGRLDSKYLSHVLGFGLRLGHRNKIAVDAIGRLNGALKGAWSVGEHSAKWNSPLIASGGVGAEVRLHLFDLAEPFVRKDIEWGNGNYRRQAETLGIETPILFTANSYSGPEGQSGRPVSLSGGVIQRSEHEQVSGASDQPVSSHIKMTIFTLGGRF